MGPNNIKLFWKTIKGIERNKASSITINERFEHFRSLGNPEEIDNVTDYNVNSTITNYDDGSLAELYSELNDPITEAEVCCAIDELKNGKAAGIDML